MKKLFFLFIILSVTVLPQPQFSSMGSMPGSFSRFGFGPRGIGMGNAMSAVSTGNLVSYYNPAVSAFQDGNSFQTGYSFLSLDRNLNFLSFTRRFDFYSVNDNSDDRKPRSSAGLSLGIINSGVSKIDGRDNQGFSTGDLSTSENQFFIGLSNKFSRKLAMGVSAKFYYYKLYEDVSTTNLGFDFGALYKFNEQFSLSFVAVDLNSKYKWDTNPIYGREGVITEDKFPLLKKFGLSYNNADIGLLTAAELVLSNGQNTIIRLGAEYGIFEGFYLRGGVDQISINNSDWGIKPSAGLSFSKQVGGLSIGFDYAFMIEQYSAMDRHIIGINIIL